MQMKKRTNNAVGFKQSPLGMIPNDWEVKRLEEIGSFSKGYGVPKNKIISEGYPCLTYGDIYTKYEYLIKNIHSYIDKKTASESKPINRGDILFAGSGETPEDIGKCATYLGNETIYAGGDIIVLTPTKDYNSFVLSYILNSDIGGKQRYKYAQGHSVVHIYPDTLKKIQIPIPPLPEQQKIAEILSTWDKAIELQTTLIEKLALRKRGLMQQLLTGKKRLKGFSEPWNKISYGNMLQEICRNVEWDDDELYDLISVRRRSEGIFRRESLYGREILTKGLGTVKEGDFIISKMQIVHGASALVTEEYDGAKVSGSYIVLIPRHKDSICMEYFNYYSQTPRFYHQTFLSSYGVHIEKMTFDLSVFFTYGMLLPPCNEQIAIAKALKTTEHEIEIEKQKLEALKQQKKGLMQQLLTGKKRVKTK